MPDLDRLLGGLKGITFCSLMILSSSLGAVFVLFPILPLLFLNRKLFRWLADNIIALWESYPVALLHIMCGVDVRVFGDEIDPEENSMLIMNHRTRLDWLFLWTALYPRALPHHKIILKKDLKFVPGCGWSMQAAAFLFLDRKWETDQELFRSAVEYVRHDGRKVNMLLFPEGTDLNPKSRGRSDAFAVTNGRPKLEHCLYPRVLGFTFLYEMMRTNKVMDAVYDITVAYPKDIIQAEKDLILRGPPKAIYFHVKRYATADLPQIQSDLETWLGTRWVEKEQTLSKFYEKNCFSAEMKGRRLNAIPLLYVSCIAWTGLVTFWLWLLSSFLIADLYFIAAMVVYSVITFYLNGIDRFELTRFKGETASQG
ncbi:Lysocardiolipin acyltransferase 1 [Hypsibius exemplaris]|uniref:Lysocardiolipin acyltransferase 1 n=1 Tax=Hypsibius exemplaris TaxID=2072580 RepID=A0A1W0WZX8_HYPEX|nr:Lysocardiolipin acyltransferase 1 [Hypsibius exemplaris]